MRMKVPITGTVLEITPRVVGDPDDPIRMIKMNLGDVSWKLITLDLDNEEMEIEVTPTPHVTRALGYDDEHGFPAVEVRTKTGPELQTALEYARSFSTEVKTKAELYALSGSPRLKNKFKGTKSATEKI